MTAFFDGTRVFNAAAGATALAADQNEVQDRCIHAFEARYQLLWSGVPCSSNAAAAPTFNDWDLRRGSGGIHADVGFWFWEASGNDMEIAFPLTGLREDEVITSVFVTVAGNNAATGGSVELYYGNGLSAIPAIDVDQVANAFNTVTEILPVSYSQSAGGLPLTASPTGLYFVLFKSSAANGASNRIYDVVVKTQFGT